MNGFAFPKYDISFCKIVVGMGERGKNPAQIAKVLGVPRSYLRKWAMAHPEFAYAFELSQDYALAFWSDEAQAGLHDPAFRSDVFAKQMSMMFPREYRGEGADVSFEETDPGKASPMAELEAMLSPRKVTSLEDQEPIGNA